MRMTALRFGLVILLVAAAPVQVSGQAGLQATPDLLVGTWSGEQLLRYPQSMLTSHVTLEITGGAPLRGRFTHDSGRKWETPIDISGDKVTMAYDHARREFLLKKGSSGELLLETAYTKTQAPPVSITVRLKKN